VTVDIAVENLYYAYPPASPRGDAVPVLQGINVEIERGETVALLGRVGAGKTTFCMALNGLVPQATGGVFRGNVRVLGLNTKEHPVADLAQHVGLVFQDPEYQLVQMRVEDEVAFGCENLGVPAAEIEERVAWALEAVGLAAYRDRSPLLLSGGEKQRLAIASLLAMRPGVLVLDEPTASLDPAGKAAVFRVLQELRRRQDLTIVMATQEIERITRFVDRVLVLHQGQIVLDGPPAKILSQVPKLEELGIGAPQIMELAHLLSQRSKHRYQFSGDAQAFKVLRSRARKARLHKAHGGLPKAPPPPAARPNPFADHSQVTVENVSFAYPDGTPALRNVSLILHPGDYVALLGPNGAGKTTLVRHLNGLLRPDSGRVLVERQDTRTTGIAELAHLVGYVFQNPDHQIFAPTVEEEIAFGLQAQQLPASIVGRRVSETMDHFGLAPFAGTPPALLGFAQRRQVALAAILAMHPKVLILDEPTGGLDWRSRQELLSLLNSLNTLGHTIVLVTHDMRLVAEHARRAVVLAGGGLLFDGDTRELFRQPAVLSQAQLRLPPVTRLANRLSAEGMPPDVLTCEEFADAWLRRLRRGVKHANQPAPGKTSRSSRHLVAAEEQERKAQNGRGSSRGLGENER
jgi:energy-coupling factor transport system ATP-binding protein